MTRLAELRSQLQTVVARRRLARRVIGLSPVLLAGLWSLAAFFLLDWLFSLGRLERVVLLALLAGAVGAAYWLLARPWLGRREDEIDVALLVERQRGIDSDLVAALEFERPQAKDWGSPQLREAVIEYVTDYGREWNLLKDFPRDQMLRRSAMVAITVAVLTLIAVLAPQHTRVMLNRLALGGMHYPTQTRIREIAVAGDAFELTEYGEHNIFARRPFGEEVELQVTCNSDGEFPEGGVLRLRGEGNGTQTELKLEPDAAQEGVYKVRLPRLVDSLSWTVELGDAWTDPAALEVVPRPVVNLAVHATPPAYAKNRATADATQGTTTRRQISVFEGSRVDLEITCENKKLVSAVASLEYAVPGEKPGTTIMKKRDLPMVAADESGTAFKLPAAKTPLQQVAGPVSFTIHVVDEDGLDAERPMEGTITVETDRPPQGTLHLVLDKFLPQAIPRIGFTANDDYAITAVNIRAEAFRDKTKKGEVVRPVWKQGQPTASKRLPLQGEFQLDLVPLKLSPGDEVRLTLEVLDYRGKQSPEVGYSAKESLAIVDEADLKEDQRKYDTRSDDQLGNVQNTLVGTENKR